MQILEKMWKLIKYSPLQISPGKYLHAFYGIFERGPNIVGNNNP